MRREESDIATIGLVITGGSVESRAAGGKKRNTQR
jgi:hypothetical protein